jgi:NADPH-dependent curcumin reductase CurA
MGYEGQNVDVDLAHPVYTRKANPGLHAVTGEWAKEMQALLDQGKISTQEIQEVAGGFDGVIEAMEMLARGTVRGRKLVVRIAG